MIDVFAHFLTAPVMSALEHHRPAFVATPNIRGRRALWNLEDRFRITDSYEGYRQVLSLALPAIVEWAPEDQIRPLVRASNDAMAEIVANHPDRFAGFVAEVGLPDVDLALEEAHRAIDVLGAVGVQIYTNAAGHPLDEDRFVPFFDEMARIGRPIWVHPTRTPDTPDYASEDASRYMMWQKIGWPYDTTVFMARLVYSGLFRRHPDLEIVTHHGGGLVPHLAGRLRLHHESPEMQRALGIPEDMTADEVIAGYQRFYGDTVFSGAAHPLTCTLEFFGVDRVLFATDMPFGAEGGDLFVRESIAAVESRVTDAADRMAILEGNARRLLRLEA